MTNFADPDVDGSVVSDGQAPATKSLELDQKDRLACLLREAVTQKKLATIVIFEGAGVVGIQHTIQRMCQTLDPRHYYVHHFPEPVKHRPVLFLREYWQKLPLIGDLAIYDGSYYHNWIVAELAAKKSQKKAEKKYRAGLIEEIQNFERTLADNGYLVLKVRVARREKDLKKDLKKDRSSIIRKSLLKTRVRELFDDYDDYVKNLTKLARKTDAPHAPWFVPPAGDGAVVATAVFDYLIARLEEALGVDSRTAVAEFDAAMDRVRRMRAAAAQVGAGGAV